MRVDVYYNLHKHLWSVRDRRTGRVILHCDRVELTNVKFHVGQRGRERVNEEQRKNVHAWVTGDLESWEHGTVTESGSGVGTILSTLFRSWNGVGHLPYRPEGTRRYTLASTRRRDLQYE